MDEIFNWPPVVWPARILLVTLMGCGAWITLVLAIRFFRPGNLMALLRAELPKLDEVGGEFAGAKASVKFGAPGKAMSSLEQRVASLEDVVEQLGLVDTEALVELHRLKRGDQDGR